MQAVSVASLTAHFHLLRSCLGMGNLSLWVGRPWPVPSFREEVLGGPIGARGVIGREIVVRRDLWSRKTLSLV